MKFLKKSKKVFFLFLIFFLGAFIRFYNLGWGLPYPFHPDERNMAEAITRLESNKLDPEFYAYGQFPLYLAYFTGTIFWSLVKGKAVESLSFTQATLALRFWSAFFSVMTLVVGYLIAKKLFEKEIYHFLSLILLVFTPGLIQIAHFGTTESILAFCFLAVVFFSLKILEKPSCKNFLGAAGLLGIALGTKISAATFFVPFVLASFFQILRQKKWTKRIGYFFYLAIFLGLILVITFLTSPYLFLKYPQSRGTLLYEISVAKGKPVLFYTRQFIKTPLVLFQLTKVFPYALGWPIFILGTLGFLLALVLLIKNSLKRKKVSFLDTSFLILNAAFVVYFFSQAFLFCKWTRFMAPIFAFFPIFATFFLSYLINLKYLSYLIILLSIFPGLLFSSIYFYPDIRFTASEWIYKNIPSNSQILFDTGNVVDIPVPTPNFDKFFSLHSYVLVSFDFYHLDEDPELFPKLLNYLETSDYIIVPSRRIFANHLRIPEKYPKTAKYYELLFSGKLGFVQIAKIEPFYSKIFKDEKAEETFTVFDHPTIRIYKNIDRLTASDYEILFR